MQSRNLPAGDGVTNPSKHRRWRRRYVWIALTAMLLVSLYALHPIVFVTAARWLNVGEQLKSPVDCLMVLGGDPATRPFLAAAIYRAGYAKKVLVVEVIAPAKEVEGVLPLDHEQTQMVLLKRGVPAEAVQLLPGPADSTRDEALSLRKYLDANPRLTVAIVTGDFHTRRSRMLFRRLLVAHRDRLHFVACPTDGYGADNWWQSSEGTFRYFSEFAKVIRDYFL